MADELATGHPAVDPIPSHQPCGGPAMDHSHRFDRDGRPKRPLDDAMTARHMMSRGFTEADVLHVLGYLPPTGLGSDAPTCR